MENASKALIIAGAILISILLISVGIIVMNAINNPVQQGAASADSQAIEIFNGKFTGYMGRQKGSTVKALYTAWNSAMPQLRNNEGNNGNPDNSKTAQNTFTVNVNGANTVQALQDNATYTVSITDANGNGFYDTVQVTN